MFSDPLRFIRKLGIESRAPSNWLTCTLRRFYCMFIPNRITLAEGNPDRLLFVYDTFSSPVTFDFLHYLYYADWLRRETGKTHIDILIVSRSDFSASAVESYIVAVGEDNLNWRLTNLLVPMCRLFSSVGRIHLVEQEEAFEIVKGYRSVHPEGYGYASPKSATVRLDVAGLDFYPALTIADTAQKIVEAYFSKVDNRRIVTITLRSYDFLSARNSDIKSWVDFAEELDPLKYRVVFIPDASMHGIATIKQLISFEVFDPACWNIELRAALYQRAWMNMGIACGPLAISCLMNKVRTIMIDRSLDCPADYIDNIRYITGLIAGERPNFYSNSCHFHLGKDDKKTILEIFNEFGK